MTADSAPRCDDPARARRAALTPVPAIARRACQLPVSGGDHERRDYRPDPAVRPDHGGGGGGPGGRPWSVRAAGPQRRGQDLAAANHGHGDPADLGPATAARPRSPLPYPTARDPAKARLPAAEPRLLRGLHGSGVRGVFRDADGGASGTGPDRGG